MNDIETNMPIDTASVKVMRSHDYCHFEVCLSTTLRNQIDATGQIDELRKTAARLADKAVEQYKVAKENADRLTHDGYTLDRLQYEARRIGEKPEAERSPQEQAKVKAINYLRFERRHYNYEDEWEEEENWEPEIPDTEDVAF